MDMYQKREMRKNKKIDEKTVDKLFIGLMAAIILINVYNIYKFI